MFVENFYNFGGKHMIFIKKNNDKGNGENASSNNGNIIWDISKEEAITLAEKIYNTEDASPCYFHETGDNYAGEIYTDTYAENLPMLFSNENDYWMKSINPEQLKKVACVAGSGDQLVDFALQGAKEITAIDINPAQLPIIYVKLKLIINGSFREFDECMLNPHSTKCMSLELLRNVLKERDSTTQAVLAFWERLFELSEESARRKKMSTQEYVRRNFFLCEKNFLDHNSNRVIQCNYLENEKAFKRAKEALKKTKITLKQGDIFNCDSDGRYTFVHLSNLHDFVVEYTDILKGIYKCCEKGAKISTYAIQLPRFILTRNTQEEAEMIAMYVTRRDIHPMVFNNGIHKAAMAWYHIKKVLYEGVADYECLTFKTGHGYDFIYNYPYDLIFIHQI